MEFSISAKELVKLILPLQAVIKETHVVPILQNVKLEFTGKKLYATGENLEINCKSSMKLYSEKINVCVPFTMLLATLKTVTDKEVSISISSKVMLITHKKGKFKIPAESSKKFPVIEKEQFDKAASFNPKAFKSSIKVANKFILSDDIAAISNISISIGKKVFIRSTDKSRLFEEVIKGSGDEGNILISGRSSVALFSLIEDSEDEIKIKFNSEKIHFQFDNSEVIVVQQNGNFPTAIFGKILDCMKQAEKLTLNHKELLTSLRRVSVLSTREKAPIVRLDLTKKEANISCENIAFSTKSEEKIEIKFDSKRTIGYNYKYLIEILSIFEKEPELFVDERNSLFIKYKKKIGCLAPVMLSNS